MSKRKEVKVGQIRVWDYTPDKPFIVSRNNEDFKSCMYVRYIQNLDEYSYTSRSIRYESTVVDGGEYGV